jgi:hypothetical protein
VVTGGIIKNRKSTVERKVEAGNAAAYKMPWMVYIACKFDRNSAAGARHLRATGGDGGSKWSDA